MNSVKTLLSVYFDQQRGWMVYRRQMRHGLIEHKDDSPAGMPRDSTADEVARHVGACNPGCVVDIDEDRCGT